MGRPQPRRRHVPGVPPRRPPSSPVLFVLSSPFATDQTGCWAIDGLVIVGLLSNVKYTKRSNICKVVFYEFSLFDESSLRC
ncbi:hypothetical protein HanPSC8_Chr11g0492631 [Helianthus annuus]|nr:hypothetical protein HanPSC8_Chr11g0492631 [Helianthus annuus]